jgi:8-oxo-dGTP diphosphatase
MKRQNSHGHGTWAPPGGHLEHGESFEECAIRETLEEMGVTIADSIFLGVTNDLFKHLLDAQEKHYVTIWMEGKYVSGEPKINSEREMSEIGWFSWHSLPEPLFLPFENFLAGRRYPATQLPLLSSGSM